VLTAALLCLLVPVAETRAQSGPEAEPPLSEMSDVSSCETECTAADPAVPFAQEPLEHSSQLCVAEIESRRYLVQAECRYSGKGDERAVQWRVVDIVRPVGEHDPMPSGKGGRKDDTDGRLLKKDEDREDPGQCHARFRRSARGYCRATPPTVPDQCPCRTIEEALSRGEKDIPGLIESWSKLVKWCDPGNARKEPCTRQTPAQRACAVDTLKFALAYKRFCRACPESCRQDTGAPKLKIDGYHQPALQAPALPREALVYEPPPAAVQIAILLDTSDSMGGLVWQVGGQLTEALRDTKASASRLEVAIYQYGNNWIPKRDLFMGVVAPFTLDLVDLRSLFKEKIHPKGGAEYCGAVIRRAVSELPWDTDPRTYKVIIVAGNESFSQGPVPFRTAIAEAARRNIRVHTLYCGKAADGTALGWEEAADLGRGSYGAINQDLKSWSDSSFGGALHRILAASRAEQD